MDSLFGYKTMPEWHKENLKSYYIYHGIFTAYPSISDLEAKFIHDICLEMNDDNRNYNLVAYYLTDQIIKGLLDKNEIKNMSNKEIIDSFLDYECKNFECVQEEKECEK